MKAALVVNTDFTTQLLDLSENEYDQLNKAVGGYIQPVQLRDDLMITVHEEGKLIGLPHNVIGTHMWNRSYGNSDVMVGNVVFTGAYDDDGYMSPLSPAWITQISELAARLREEYLNA